MFLGQIVWIDTKTARAKKLDLAYELVIKTKNKQKLSTATVKYSRAAEQKIEKLKIGAVIQIEKGHYSYMDKEQSMLCTNVEFCIEVDYLSAPGTVRLPIATPCTNILLYKKKILKKNASIMFIVKGCIEKHEKCILQCIDDQSTFFEMVLMQGQQRHLSLRYGDVVLLTGARFLQFGHTFCSAEHPVLATEKSTIIEKTPFLEKNHAIARLASSLSLQKVFLRSLREINTVLPDSIAVCKGRVLKISPRTRSLILADKNSGLVVQLEKEELSRLIEQGSASPSFPLPQESLLFSEVILQAVILSLGAKRVIQSVTVYRNK